MTATPSQKHATGAVALALDTKGFGGIPRVTRQLGSLGQALVATQHATTKLGQSASGLNRLYQSIGGLGGLLVAHKVRQFVDTWTEAENRARIFGKTLERALAIQQQMYEVAQSARLEFDGAVRLYARLAIIQKDLNLSFKEIQGIVGGVGKSLVVSGTSALQARGALIQFTQALGAGIVRAEEMNALLEGALRIVQAVARNIPKYHGSVAALRKDVVSGNVTSKQFVEAFLKGIPQISEEFALVRPTIQQGFTVFTNSMIKFVGQIDQLTSFSTGLANAMVFASKNLNEIGLILGSLVGVLSVIGAGKLVKFGARYFTDIRRVSKVNSVRRGEMIQHLKDREAGEEGFSAIRDGGAVGRYMSLQQKGKSALTYGLGGGAVYAGASLLSEQDFTRSSDRPSFSEIESFRDKTPYRGVGERSKQRELIYTGETESLRQDSPNPKSNPYYPDFGGFRREIPPYKMQGIYRYGKDDVFSLGERGVPYDYNYKDVDTNFREAVKKLDEKIADVVKFTGVDMDQLINSINLPGEEQVREQLQNIPKGLDHKVKSNYMLFGKFALGTHTSTADKIEALLDQQKEVRELASKLGYMAPKSGADLANLEQITKQFFGKDAKGLLTPSQYTVRVANTGIGGADQQNLIKPPGSDFTDEKKSLDDQTKILNLLDTIFPRFLERIEKLRQNIVPQIVAQEKYDSIDKALKLALTLDNPKIFPEGADSIRGVADYQRRRDTPILANRDNADLAVERLRVDSLEEKLRISNRLRNEKVSQSKNIPQHILNDDLINDEKIIAATREKFYKEQLRKETDIESLLKLKTPEERFREELKQKTRFIGGISDDKTNNLVKAFKSNELLKNEELIKKTLESYEEIYKLSKMTNKEQAIAVELTRLKKELSVETLSAETKLAVESAIQKNQKEEQVKFFSEVLDQIKRETDLVNRKPGAEVFAANIDEQFKHLGGVSDEQRGQLVSAYGVKSDTENKKIIQDTLDGYTRIHELNKLNNQEKKNSVELDALREKLGVDILDNETKLSVEFALQKNSLQEQATQFSSIYRDIQDSIKLSKLETPEERFDFSLDKKFADVGGITKGLRDALNISFSAGVVEKNKNIIKDTLKGYEDIYHLNELSNQEKEVEVGLNRLRKDLAIDTLDAETRISVESAIQRNQEQQRSAYFSDTLNNAKTELELLKLKNDEEKYALRLRNQFSGSGGLTEDESNQLLEVYRNRKAIEHKNILDDTLKSYKDIYDLAKLTNKQRLVEVELAKARRTLSVETLDAETKLAIQTNVLKKAKIEEVESQNTYFQNTVKQMNAEMKLSQIENPVEKFSAGLDQKFSGVGGIQEWQRWILVDKFRNKMNLDNKKIMEDILGSYKEINRLSKLTSDQQAVDNALAKAREQSLTGTITPSEALAIRARVRIGQQRTGADTLKSATDNVLDEITRSQLKTPKERITFDVNKQYGDIDAAAGLGRGALIDARLNKDALEKKSIIDDTIKSYNKMFSVQKMSVDEQERAAALSKLKLDLDGSSLSKEKEKLLITAITNKQKREVNVDFKDQITEMENTIKLLKLETDEERFSAGLNPKYSEEQKKKAVEAFRTIQSLKQEEPKKGSFEDDLKKMKDSIALLRLKTSRERFAFQIDPSYTDEQRKAYLDQFDIRDELEKTKSFEDSFKELQDSTSLLRLKTNRERFAFKIDPSYTDAQRKQLLGQFDIKDALDKKKIIKDTVNSYNDLHDYSVMGDREIAIASGIGELRKRLGVEVLDIETKITLQKLLQRNYDDKKLKIRRKDLSIAKSAGDLSFNEEERARQTIENSLIASETAYTHKDVDDLYKAQRDASKNSEIFSRLQSYKKSGVYRSAFNSASNNTFNSRARFGDYSEQLHNLRKDSLASGGALSSDDYNQKVEEIKRSFPEFQSSWERLILSMEEGTQRWGDMFADTLTTAFTTGKLDFKSFISSVITDLIGMITRAYITNPIFELIASGIGGLFGGGPVSASSYLNNTRVLPGLAGRATGGSVRGHSAYVVGEEGPEVFLPTSSGMVIPNNKLLMGSGGSGNVQATNNVKLEINVGNNGTVTSSSGHSDSRDLQLLNNKIAAQTIATVTDELRPGGVLNRYANNR